MSNLSFHKNWFVDYFVQANKLSQIDNTKTNYKNAVANARLSIEAICKYIIYDKEDNPTPIIKKRLVDYIEFIASKNYFHSEDITKNQALKIDFHRVRIGGNEGAHHLSDDNNDITKGDCERSIVILHYIAKWFYCVYLKESIPTEVNDILAGKLNADKIKREIEDWNTFESKCANFNPKNQYILISSPNLKQTCSGNQLSLLARIDWKLILDFDNKSKENGFYSNALDEYQGRSIQDLTIESKNIDFEQNKALTYWFFANGIYPTIKSENNLFLWKAKYTNKLKNVVEEVIKKSNFNKTIIVCFWGNAEYLKALFEAFYMFADAPEKLEVIIINENKLSENEITKTLSQEIEVFRTNILNFRYNELIEGFREIKSKIVPINKNRITVPAFNTKREYSPIDLPSEYYYDLKNRNGIELLHFDIQSIYLAESNDFYFGGEISWYDLFLNKGKDVERIKTSTIIQDVRDALSEGTSFYKVDLFHEPGAGGTTVARRIAYEIGVQSGENPTLIISKHHPVRTFDAIRELYVKVNQKPILAVIEEWEFSEEKLRQLREQIFKARIHVVVLFVQRVFNIIPEKKYRRFLKATLQEKDNKSEINDFEFVYSNIKPERKIAIKAIPATYKNDLNFITPFIYGLTAFQEEFLKLDNYIQNWLNLISSEEKRKFIGFISLINYYIQNEVNELPFFELFREKYVIEENSQIEDFFKIKDDKEYNALNTFLIQSYELRSTIGGIQKVPNGMWKTRHSIIARETIKQLLVGINGDKENWKINLSIWLEELINLIKISNSVELCEPDRLLLEALFIDKQKSLYTDIEEDSNKITRFAPVIEDLNEYKTEVAQSVLKLLAETFSENPYFRQHLARHYYYNAEVGFFNKTKNFRDVIGDYQLAEKEALAAIEVGNHNDPVLHHTLGDALLKQIQFIKKYYMKSSKTIEEIEYDIISESGLFEKAKSAFNNSISNDENSVFRYLSYIKLLTNVIDFGRLISNHEKFESFIKDEKYAWYNDKIQEALKTIEIAEINMNYYNAFDKAKYREQLINEKVNIYRLVGQSIKQQKQLLSLANNATTNQHRAFYKTSYVISILNSKLDFHSKSFDAAWSNLTKNERDIIKQQLEENMELEPNNAFYTKLWLKNVRQPNYDIDIELCEKVFARWYSNIETSFKENDKILVEANYYLYVFNAILLINAGQQMSTISLSKTEAYLKRSKGYSKKIQNLNDVFCFEWFGKQENGIEQIVNSNKLGNLESKYGFFKNVSLLQEVEGLIINIGSPVVKKEGKKRSEGEILLDIGLKAFFVPIHGGFYIDENGNEIQASFTERDEGKRVKFYLGFTYSRLQAWQVLPINTKRAIVETKILAENIIITELNSSQRNSIEFKVRNVNRQRNVLQGEIKDVDGWVEIPFKPFEYSTFRYSFGKIIMVYKIGDRKYKI